MHDGREITTIEGLGTIALSLNASFMYLGFSLGAALGGFSLVHIDARHLGFVGAACELVALTLLLVNQAIDMRSHSDGTIWPSTARIEHGAAVRIPHVSADDTPSTLVEISRIHL